MTRNSQATALSAANVKMRRMTRLANQEFDAAFAQRIETEGFAVTCKAGCSACCDQAVLITAAEADLIISRHRDLVRAALPEFARQKRVLVEAGAHDGPRDLAALMSDDVEEERAKMLANWYRQRIACAFLDPETKLCRIYDVRPLACRSHVVWTPAELCDRRPGAGQWQRDSDEDGYECLGDGPEFDAARAQHMLATATGFDVVAMGLMPTILSALYRADASAGTQASSAADPQSCGAPDA
jgi:Fe-S-cluster containining protein